MNDKREKCSTYGSGEHKYEKEGGGKYYYCECGVTVGIETLFEVWINTQAEEGGKEKLVDMAKSLLELAEDAEEDMQQYYLQKAQALALLAIEERLDGIEYQLN